MFPKTVLRGETTLQTGQTSVSMHQMKFTNEQGLPTCTLSIIPPKCTPFCQPCDVYFYRQVKNFIRRMQNCSHLLQTNREITSREDVIKIHALIHDQLQALIYSNMLRYAWYAAKLKPNKEYFLNVNQISFPESMKKENCNCEEISSAFIQCSWCRTYLCFECFYDEYHPTHCIRQS
ncbi:hypothetical protein X777_01173 [Ooceraea biroi]|uniref:Transposase Tc5 C-terminal domain-containing protein n=1 Tax=Ooceraea biroi TaxID=2015173 RepID=A0A026WTP6_OOCBI|nr:hypothetical protein X777_01173 [Ooceraea biroi]